MAAAESQSALFFVQLLSWALLLSACAHVSCVEGAAFESSSEKALPAGACYWKQGSLINKTPTGPSTSTCKFEVRDAEFLQVLGSSPKVQLLVATDAHEGGVYYPDTAEFIFSSNRRSGTNGQQVSDLKKVSIKTAEVTTLIASSTDVPNGMVLNNEGKLLVCQQGSETRGGYIQEFNPTNVSDTKIAADNWFGIPFNSPNDVVVKKDGSVWFTDPSYGSVQGFRTAPKVNNQIYKISTSGVVDAMADGFVEPNGLAFSADEKRLYITDTGFATGMKSNQYDVSKPHSIYVFNVDSDGMLSNRRLFAAVGVYDGSSPGLGIPDGIKVDSKDRVYVATVDGIQVFSRTGTPLGLIRIPGASNMGFAGPELDTLYVLNGTTISYIKLQVTGVGLKYASKF